MNTENNNAPMRVCVYCASSNHIAEVYGNDARELGKLMATNGMELVYGGGAFGLMGEVSTAVKEHGGKVRGVIPQFMVDKGWLRPGLDNVVAVDTMATRKQTMAQMSDAAVVLPGGLGTMDELFDILSLKKLGLYHNPIIILNTNHFYDALLELLQRMMGDSFLSPAFANLWQVANTPAEAVALLRMAVKSTPIDDDMIL